MPDLYLKALSNADLHLRQAAVLTVLCTVPLRLYNNWYRKGGV